jgi:ribonuclease-3
VNEKGLSERIKYTFKDGELLKLALTHSSCANEMKMPKYRSNERLEFLGDAVLEFLISEELYSRFPALEEGEMTRLRAAIVCEASLCRCGNAISVGDFLRLGRGEEQNGGRKRPSIVADTMEALIGAVYVDGGVDAVKAFVSDAFSPVIEAAAAGRLMVDYKSKLQEMLQMGGQVSIEYEIEREEGPEHDKLFFVALRGNGAVIGRGCGKSKKEAEQSAAKEALEKGWPDCILNV